MITVNSISGGKTSSYIAMHYPADVDIFALVCLDDHNAAGSMKKVDPLIRTMVTERLMATCPQYGEFVATPEELFTKTKTHVKQSAENLQED